MLKTLEFGRRTYFGLSKAIGQKRFFLSEAYRCEEAWASRLQTPLLQKVNPEDMFFNLEQKYTTNGKVSAVDIDIFANSVVNDFQVEELLTLIHNLRLTAETTYTLESTHHAVIRYLLAHERFDDLINVLHDRLNYGIFPSYFCYNLLMDTFLKREEYALAAKIAVLPMLQEDLGHPITNLLSLFSCHKHMEHPEHWKKPQPPKDESKEEIKIRVRYLINPYFDDHFDLTDPLDLVGKTLAFQGKHMNNAMGRTCQMRGLILYKKYDQALKLLQEWLSDVKEDVVYEEFFALIEKDYNYIPEEERTNEYTNLLSQFEVLKSKKLCKNNMLADMKKAVTTAVNKYSETDIAQQHQDYLDWTKKRDTVLNKQLVDIDRATRLAKINEMKKDLQEREQLLTFFEHEEEIELQIEELEQKEKEEDERIMQMPNIDRKLRKLTQTEEYVPPELRKNRN